MSSYIQPASQGFSCMVVFFAFIVCVIHVVLSAPRPQRGTTFHSSVSEKMTIKLKRNLDFIGRDKPVQGPQAFMGQSV